MDSGLSRCPECGAEIAPDLLSCPACGRLLHAATLKTLAANADAAEHEGNLQGALMSWREALSLLPPETRQHATVLHKIKTLSAQVEDGDQAAPSSAWKKGAAGLGGLGLLAFKFKTVILLALTKGKFLIVGLTKLPTLLSMLVYVGIFWNAWGWKFIVGIALSIYVHEMGHVWMFHRYGIPTAAPMFLPGFGAVTRGRYYPTTPIEAARIGLAGPMWGLGAAAVCYVVYVATGESYWGAIAQTGGLINLLNLLPIVFLDGNQGIRSLSRGQRALAALACFAMYYFTAQANPGTASDRQNPILLLIGIIMGARTVMGEAPRERDDFGLFQYVLLILTLGALAAIDLSVHVR